MRIAQVAPMYESVPPTQYGGTERVVWSLCEELVRRGHDVTLFASGDSQTSAHLVPTTPQSLRRQMTREELVDVSPWLHLEMLSKVYRRAADFDIIHSHLDHLALPLSRMVDVPTVTTLHGRLDLDFLPPIYSRYRDAALVSISNSQREPLNPLDLNWVGTVYNGIAIERFRFEPHAGDYLVFVGRIAPEKRPDLAVEIARRSGMPLKVAAKVDPVDEQYWREEIEPLFIANDVDYIGEVNDAQKALLFAGAYATLFPVDWPEPFGLVMAESLACGTPVIALRRGSVPEVLTDGVSGFICDTLDELVAAVPRVARLDRAVCRREAERFGGDVMAAGYEAVYQKLMGRDLTKLKLLEPSLGTPTAHTRS